MILYLDTSSLVKLYLDEEGSATVRAQVAQATVVTTSVIAYPESRSAFARQHREGRLAEEDSLRLKTELGSDGSSFLTLHVSEAIWRHAGQLAETYALRGFDSLHLASFLSLARLDSTRPIEFSGFDERLNEAVLAATRSGGGS